MNKRSLSKARSLTSARRSGRRVASGLAGIAVVGSALVATSAATTPPASAATTCRSYVYSYGGTSTCITYIQRMLNTLSSNWGNLYYIESPAGKQLTVDGAYGANTTYVVTKFQQAENSLRYALAVDGIVGPQTWSRLCSEVLWNAAGETQYAPWANAVAAAHAAGC